MTGGLKIRVECPNCKSIITYNKITYKKKLNDDGLLKCKVCSYIFCKNETDEIIGNLFMEMALGKTPRSKRVIINFDKTNSE